MGDKKKKKEKRKKKENNKNHENISHRHFFSFTGIEQ